MLNTRSNYIALAMSMASTVLAQSTTTTADRSMVTDPVVNIFLPGPEWQPLTGSVVQVDEPPFSSTVIAHCPPGGAVEKCGSSQGDYGRFTIAPSSFYAAGIVGTYSYIINCTVPASTEATCTTFDDGPISRDENGLVESTQTGWTRTTYSQTLTGSQVTSYPVTLTAGATKFLNGYIPTPTPTSDVVATVNVVGSTNSADANGPKATLALLMGVAFLFFFY